MAEYSKLLPGIAGHWAEVLPSTRADPTFPGCVNAVFAPAKVKGYSQKRVAGTKYYVHIMAAMSKWKRAPGQDDEASHLCHNPACVNPDHLVFESGEVNKTRGCCKMFGQLPGYRCPHIPVCFGCTSLMHANVE